MTKVTLRGKPDAGNPHVRLGEGEVALAKPRRGSLLYKKTFLLLGALAASVVFGKYETPVNWIYREGEGTSVTNMASYFDGDNWEGGMPPNAGSVSAYFPSVSGVKYVRFDQNVTLGGAVAMGPAQDRNLTSTPRLVLVSDAHVLDTCSAVNGSSYPIESIDLYADLDHANWSYFTSLCLAGDTLHDGTMVLAWGTFCHHLDWYAKTAGGARTNALAAAELYQGSGWISLFAPESSATNVTGRWSGRAGSAFLHRTGDNHVPPPARSSTARAFPKEPSSSASSRVRTSSSPSRSRPILMAMSRSTRRRPGPISTSTVTVSTARPYPASWPANTVRKTTS